MRILLKLLLVGLLLVLAAAVGTEVAALRHLGAPEAATASTPPVVVRKAAHVPAPAKSVRPLPARRPGARRHLGS